MIPIILSLDKTQIRDFGGKQAYSVYMTIGNISKEICKKPSCNAQILVAYLPIPSLEHVKNTAACRRMTINLFHSCMNIITKPLIAAGLNGMPVTSGDGVTQ